MRIIVVGAGEVGSYVAERLSRQGHHVVLIESDPERFRQVDQDLDVMTLRGSGTDPVTLAAAGIEQADLLVAVTAVDETNIVSALLARRAGVEYRTFRRLNPELGGDTLPAGQRIELKVAPRHERVVRLRVRGAAAHRRCARERGGGNPPTKRPAPCRAWCGGGRLYAGRPAAGTKSCGAVDHPLDLATNDF